MEHDNSRIDAAQAPPPIGGERRTSRRRWILATTITAVVAIDQVTKTLAVEMLGSGPAHIGVLHLRLVANRGLLMGMVQAPLVVVAVATLLVVFTAIRARRGNGPLNLLAFGLLAGGALGNFADRLLQRENFPANAVVDWLSFGGMTFNLADVALLVAALMLIAGPTPSSAESGSTARGFQALRATRTPGRP